MDFLVDLTFTDTSTFNKLLTIIERISTNLTSSVSRILTVISSMVGADLQPIKVVTTTQMEVNNRALYKRIVFINYLQKLVGNIGRITQISYSHNVIVF